MNESGGTYMRAEPALVKELVWAGFDMVSRANNHAGDYGVLGMNLTSKYVADAGLVQAGVGQSLAEAREAKFLETPKGTSRADLGRLDIHRSLARGIDARRHARAPGLNPLRFTTIYAVTPRADGNSSAAWPTRSTAVARGSRRTASELLRPALHRWRQAGVRTEPNPRIRRRSPRRQARLAVWPIYTIVTIHRTRADRSAAAGAISRRPSRTRWSTPAPTSSSVMARTCSAASSCTKASRCLYSLGDFIFENETLLRLPERQLRTVPTSDRTPTSTTSTTRRYDRDKTAFPPTASSGKRSLRRPEVPRR